jgi:hypothetical protein
VSVPIVKLLSFPDPVQTTFSIAHAAILAGIPVAFLLAVLRRMLTRHSIAVLAERLRSTTDVDMVLLALREALSDPELEILYWMPDTRGYVDTAGTPQPAPNVLDPTFVADVRADDGEPLAVIVADPALQRHPQLATPAARALALSLANARLHARIRAQIARVQHSQQRLPAAVAAERRNIENDIAEGADRQLSVLAGHLRAFLDTNVTHACACPDNCACAQARTCSDRCACADHRVCADRKAIRALRSVLDQLPVVQLELAGLARGMVPGVLAESGLRAAIATMTETMPLRVELDLPLDRFDRGTESAAYFMISEALVNAVKHAQARSALVRGNLAAGHLHIEVTDDGIGGADPAGGGLTGITERMRACGGQLAITSTRGVGTRLRAVIPVPRNPV